MAEPAPPTVVRAVEVSKRLRGPHSDIGILAGVNLSIEAGQAVAIVGASGAGKSTLLGLLAGLDVPSSGEIALFGQALSGLDEDGRAALRRGRIGFVFQDFQLLPNLTAVENVLLPLELGGRVRSARPRALEALEGVGLAARARHYPTQLSGGEQQRVALARAFVVHPQILFADEPTGNLDEETGAAIARLMFRLRDEQGASLVLVTHDPTLTGGCDVGYRLIHGRLEPL